MLKNTKKSTEQQRREERRSRISGVARRAQRRKKSCGNGGTRKYPRRVGACGETLRLMALGRNGAPNLPLSLRISDF
ncbi:uncharacterized protein DS421_12g374300 [Arachis hypogaea]|nr:uncharacterized protein DS421_12g374300 [Arachis hypogaea]